MMKSEKKGKFWVFRLYRLYPNRQTGAQVVFRLGVVVITEEVEESLQ